MIGIVTEKLQDRIAEERKQDEYNDRQPADAPRLPLLDDREVGMEAFARDDIIDLIDKAEKQETDGKSRDDLKQNDDDYFNGR